MDELISWLKLVRVSGLGLPAVQLFALLRQFGSLAALADAPQIALLNLDLKPRAIAQLRAAKEQSIDRELDWLSQSHHHFIAFGSPLYPPQLMELQAAPLGLFVSGDPNCLSLPQLAIVGTRHPSAGGRETAESFARHLVGCGLAITSGLAIGIDSASHRGALAGDGRTIAVCGTGLDIIYPRSSVPLAANIEQQGALISEFPPGTAARKGNFPLRNRIISGLALGTLVVEAAMHSGSLITARLAGEQGREVFAIPGSIHNPMSKGCHQLIRQGAKLVDTVEDILSELGPLAAALLSQPSSKSIDRAQVFGTQLDKDYKILLDALGFEPASVDVLVSRTQLKADEVASMLLILELEGHIEALPGGWYERVQREAAQ